jgi:hypothetical protein
MLRSFPAPAEPTANRRSVRTLPCTPSQARKDRWRGSKTKLALAVGWGSAFGLQFCENKNVRLQQSSKSSHAQSPSASPSEIRAPSRALPSEKQAPLQASAAPSCSGIPQQRQKARISQICLGRCNTRLNRPKRKRSGEKPVGVLGLRDLAGELSQLSLELLLSLHKHMKKEIMKKEIMKKEIMRILWYRRKK